MATHGSPHGSVRRIAAALGTLVALALSFAASADFDHRVTFDDSGIWSRSTQNVLRYGVWVTEIGGALWLGGDDKLGRTFYESLDASVFGTATSEVAKRVFGRRRPADTPDPNDWFNGSCCKSFPSSEVTLQAAFVTPIIVNYAADNPWVWALELLPIYDAVARVKVQAHWQTDVLAGYAIGTGFGYWAAKRNSPLILQIMPHGIAVGLHTRF